MSRIYGIILAAGKGTRMNSNHPKAIHKLLDKSMIECVSESVSNAGVNEQIVVVGYKSEEIINLMGEKVKYAYQEKQLGTGHAVMQAEDLLSDINGYTIVLNGDAPLITAKTIRDTIDFHINNQYACTVITAKLDNPTGYGRIVRDEKGNVIKIVEQKDATDTQKQINEINSGLYCFTTKYLFDALKKIDNNNTQEEYYLTDTLEILRDSNHKIGAILIEDYNETRGVNSREQLFDLTKVMQKRVNKRLMESGVTLIDPDSTYISSDAIVDVDTIIYPGTIIEGKTNIGHDCIIGPNATIINSNIFDNCVVNQSYILNSQINENQVGPFEKIIQNRRG